MTEGIWIRVTITLLAATQAVVAAVLGFADILPVEWKVALVAVSAGLAVVINQIPSWQGAPAAGRALKKAKVD